MYVKEKADKAIKFIQNLKHTKDRFYGHNFSLIDWQFKIVNDVFGTIKKDGYRQYRTAFVEVAKKNGKSELAAGIALYCLCADGEMGAEVYLAAMDRDQASMVYDVAAMMVRQSKTLLKYCKPIDSRKRIVFYKTNSFLQVLSADVPSKHGLNPSCVIFDELHAQKTRQLWDVLTFGSSIARSQPLLFVITTAGFDRNSICWEQYNYAKQIQRGIKTNPSFYTAIYELDDKDDWTKEKNWIKANPSLGITFDIEKLREAFQKAKDLPSEENLFKRFHLNKWTSQETKWVGLDKWDATAGIVIEDKLKGLPCYAGLDLSSISDITAVVLTFWIGDKLDVLPYFFIPKDSIEQRTRKDDVKYDVWVREGYIYATPGNVVDYQFVEDKITELAKKFDIKEMGYDPWNATMLTQRLAEKGMNMIEVHQGFKSLSAPTKQLETLIMQKKISHNANPVLRWMFDNVMVKTDQTGNIKPDKEKSKEKIDGISALVVAVSRAMLFEDETRSTYDTHDILVVT